MKVANARHWEMLEVIIRVSDCVVPHVTHTHPTWSVCVGEGGGARAENYGHEHLAVVIGDHGSGLPRPGPLCLHLVRWHVTHITYTHTNTHTHTHTNNTQTHTHRCHAHAPVRHPHTDAHTFHCSMLVTWGHKAKQYNASALMISR